MKQVRSLAPAALVVLSLALAGCGSSGSKTDDATKPDTVDVECDYPVVVQDLAGNEVEITSVESVVVTDNRAFAILNEWGIQPSAAAVTLMSRENSWKSDESILDTGSHAEPDFDKVIEADPTLIISGYRYGDHADKLKQAAPDAAFVDTDNPDLSATDYTKAQVEMLGEIFCKQSEAEELLGQFEVAVADAKAAYDPEMTVMGLVTSGNEIRYANPTDGRGASVFFSLLDLTPALDQDGSSNHQGDDISLEAIGQSGADFFLVMDRDAAVADEGEATPAIELIEGSSALAAVPAVVDDAIYVMPWDYYLTEDIYAYIDVLKGLQAAFEKQDAAKGI